MEVEADLVGIKTVDERPDGSLAEGGLLLAALRRPEGERALILAREESVGRVSRPLDGVLGREGETGEGVSSLAVVEKLVGIFCR